MKLKHRVKLNISPSSEFLLRLLVAGGGQAHAYINAILSSTFFLRHGITAPMFEQESSFDYRRRHNMKSLASNFINNKECQNRKSESTYKASEIENRNKFKIER